MARQLIFNGIDVDQLLDALKEIVRVEVNKAYNNEAKPPKYLTQKEAAKRLNICRTSLHTWTKEGKIKAHRIGSRVLYKEADLEQALISVNKYGRRIDE